MKKSLVVFIIGIIAGLHGNAAEPKNKHTILHSGFESFAQGSFGKSGNNLYVSKGGRIEVINRWDINRDGYNDVLISNDHNEYEVVDALIYWNSDQGFTSLLSDLWKKMPLAQVAFDLMDGKAKPTRLPAFGGGRSVVVDLNRDGYAEIVFCNYIHNYPGVRSAYIYWGSPTGYAAERKTELPTLWAAGVAAANLNADDYPDLVFANLGAEAGLESISRELGRESYIYWGSATGFDPNKPVLLPTKGAIDVAIADVNGDGRLDLAFINNSPIAQEVQVFFGNAEGYDARHMQTTAVALPTSIRSGEVNGDKYADLVVTTAVKWQTATLGLVKNDQPAPQQSTFVFLGGERLFTASSSQQLPSLEARDSAIGNFNGDQFPDLAIANYSDGTTTVVASYIYWGSAQGFTAANRSELPTLGATGVSAADLNEDGHPDLVFSNAMDEASCDVPSYIYWGSSTGFAHYLRSSLQSFGAASVNAADLNGDGKPEVILVNQYSGEGRGKIDSQIFWGNPHHYYSTASITSLPGHGAYDTTVADFNDDGFNDVVIANMYGRLSYLYWGCREGFSVSRRTDLVAGPSSVSAAADLNRDGYLDLVFTGANATATLIWGSKDGFSEAARTILKLKTTRSTNHVIADLNRDGFLDLVFHDDYDGHLQILWGGAEGYSEERSWARYMTGGNLELADLNQDGSLDFIVAGGFDIKKKSYNTRTRIFYGTSEGTPSEQPAVELAAYGACECAVADLNQDGFLDLVLSNYMSDSTRSLPAFIYWGSKEGYSEEARTDLPAESSCGIQTVDLNQDGYPEIVVHNHLKNGKHSINSYIYWNQAGKFDRNRRTELPTFGPHYSQWTDPGNLYTRKMEEEYVSAPIQLPTGAQSVALRWKGNEPNGTKLKLQLRTSANREHLARASWTGPEGTSSFYETPGRNAENRRGNDRWLQYRVVFSSRDAGDWPNLEEVAIDVR